MQPLLGQSITRAVTLHVTNVAKKYLQLIPVMADQLGLIDTDPSTLFVRVWMGLIAIQERMIYRIQERMIYRMLTIVPENLDLKMMYRKVTPTKFPWYPMRN